MKHKYKVNDIVWCGNLMVKVLRRLNNNQYQVSFNKWDRDGIAVLKESDLSLVPNNNIRLDTSMKTATVKFGDTIIAEERSMSIGKVSYV